MPGLDNAHLMRLAGRFSRRVRAYAKAHRIPVIDCPVTERKHELAEQYLKTTTVTEGVFLILVGRAQAPVWEVSGKHHLERKRPMPYVNHYSFRILDRDWGHLTIKLSGHPPFPAQVILNGHEWVACQARQARIRFTKEGNCFTQISNPAALARIADTLSDPGTIGRLRQVADRWIYSACLCFALSLDEQQQSGLRTSTPTIGERDAEAVRRSDDVSYHDLDSVPTPDRRSAPASHGSPPGMTGQEPHSAFPIVELNRGV